MLKASVIFGLYPWRELYDPASIPNWILAIIGAFGIYAALKTLRTIKEQTRETARSAKATEDSVEASRRSLEVQEAEFFQWLDIGNWSIEYDPDAAPWGRSGIQILNHPGALKVRLRFPLINNTPRPLFIHSVRTLLEIGPDKTARQFVVEEPSQVPPRSEYSVVIDTVLTEAHVTQYIAYTLFIEANVRVSFSNALGKPDEGRFGRLIACRWSEDTATVSKGHKSEQA